MAEVCSLPAKVTQVWTGDTPADIISEILEACAAETGRQYQYFVSDEGLTVREPVSYTHLDVYKRQALASWVKAQAAKSRSYKCIVHNVTPLPDDMHVVHFVNESVTFADARGEQDGEAYLPSLLAIMAVCNVERGCTGYHCSNLAAVEEVADNDTAVGAGKFILFNDEEGAVRIGQGINSLTTLDGKTKTEDMQFIETVEAMDLMRDDITSTFRSTYLGSYRNTRDNQMLFIAALNSSYFRQLARCV